MRLSLNHILIVILTALSTLAYSKNNLAVNSGDMLPVTTFPTCSIYNWINNQPGIGLPASGSGDLQAFVAVNNGNVPFTATIAGTPISSSLVYISNSDNSNISLIDTRINSAVASMPASLSPSNLVISLDVSQLYESDYFANTVTIINTDTRTKTIVNPVIPPNISATVPSGTITTCQGTASVSPNIQQFAVSGSNLTSAVTATAPQGFEVSLTAGSGYGSIVTINAVNGILSNTMVYVRAASSAAVGNTSQNITLSSAGAQSQTVAVTETVNALPMVNAVANQTITNGAATTAVNFAGSSNTVFNWVNNMPGIGSPATGSGNIASFTAVNNGAAPVVATITATPVSEGFAYIANSDEGTISVINVANNAIVAKISPPHDPFCVCISPDGSKAYIGCSGGSSTVLVINTITNTIINNIPVSSTGESTGIAVSADGHWLYVANYVDNTVSVVSTASNAVVDVISVGNYPYGIAISPDGSKVYVAFTFSNYLSVISTVTNTVTGTINLGFSAADVVVSPDGSKIYATGNSGMAIINPATDLVTNLIRTPAGMGVMNISPDGSKIYVASGLNNVLVINASTYEVIATIGVGLAPNGISVSPDRDFVYVANTESNNVSVINTLSNMVVATVKVGISPISLGNFVTAGSGCTGNPTTFTITVNPSPKPTITAGNVSGSINTCLGTASVSPNIQQFTVSGANLTADISVVAPSGFEISTDLDFGYAAALSLPQTAGTVSVITIYVRAAGTAAAGNPTGEITFTSTGAATVNVPVQGSVFAMPTVNPIQSQSVITGSQTTATYFTGTAENFNWVNSNTAIGLPASGSGNIAAFTAVDNTSGPLTATITVTPVTVHGASKSDVACTGTSATFTITVNLVPQSQITTEGNLSSLTTTYGTPSSSTLFNISGSALTGNIFVMPPAGFEVSTDNTTFTSTITITATGGSISTTPVYIRLAAITPAGTYSGNIVLISGSIIPVNLPMPASTVTPALLTITADNKSRLYETATPLFTASYSGFVNSQGPTQLTAQPQLSTIATITSPVGQYPIIVDGASSPNYIFNYVNATLTIEPQFLVIPNTFTPNGDGINDTWNIKYLENYPNCRVTIFNRYGERLYSSIGYAIPWDGKYKGAEVPVGTYYYIIDTNSNLKTYAGYLTVIR